MSDYSKKFKQAREEIAFIDKQIATLFEKRMKAAEDVTYRRPCKGSKSSGIKQ